MIFDYDFYKELHKRKDVLLNRIQFLKKLIEYLPEGKIRITNEHGYSRYYHRTDTTSRLGKYIRDVSLAVDLTTKMNAIKAIECMNKELEHIYALINNSTETSIDELPHHVLFNRKSYEIPDFRESMYQEIKEKWLTEEYEGNVFDPFSDPIFSDSGIRVRSKSEKDIINVLEARGIVFQYEYPVIINGVVYYPDFKCLHPRTLETIYWEHLGSMDDPAYVSRQLKKFDEYRQAGIVLGKNLFITMETKNKPLNIITINNFIEDYLT